MDLVGHVAVVTGGGSGMGLACAQALQQCGASVMVWDLKVDHLDFPAISCDVSSAQAVEDALAETIKRLGAPRMCINCAGIAPARRMVDKDEAMPLEIFKHIIDVNLNGTFNVMRVVAEAMIKLPCVDNSEERGIIINTASVAAYEGQIGQTAYSASKGGVVAMTLPAARELAQFGIRVNAIAPGLIETPLLLAMPDAVQTSLANSVPFPRRFGKVDEFSALVLHIIGNSYLNGETIRLDGALRMQPK